MKVTPATPPDIPRLCELLGLLFTQEAEFEPNVSNQANGLSAIIADPSIGLILALRKDQEIIGMVNLLFTISTHLGARVALLEDMIIDPAHRGQGTGTFLIHEAKRIATERGCQRLTLLTDTANSKARAFYKKAGFLESKMTPYRCPLPLPSA